MRFLLFFIVISTKVYADQGLNISCLNMLNIIGQKHEPLNFSLDVIHFKYFDKVNNSYKKIKTNDLIIGDDYFTAKFQKYELTFQNMLFKDDKKERMVMSKYDFKNNKFLDHYICDYNITDIK